MNEAQRSTLQRFRRRLADDIIMTEEFLAQLIEEGIFEWGMVNIIKAEKTETEQTYKMLDILPKRGPLAFDRFVTVMERDYPWLATLLVSSTKSTSTSTPINCATRESMHDMMGSADNNRSTPRLSEGGCDADIKKLVASFVHRQFGHSKRISEKDKKAVEKFVTEQLQGERTRYQSMLAASARPTSTNSDMSDGDDVFRNYEIQEHLFKIHVRIEPHLNDDDETLNNNDGISVIRERVLPDDLSFEIIHQEMERLCRKLRRLESDVCQSIIQFKPELQRVPLPELVDQLHKTLAKQHEEMIETEEENSRLLDEIHRYSEHIEKLEKERREYRGQINVVHQDMAKLRQEKNAMQERVYQLEKAQKERLDKESTLDNLRLLVKDMRSNGLTPRQGHGEDTARTSQNRRSLRLTQGKTSGGFNNLYARRYTANPRTTTKKKNTTSYPNK